MSDLHTTDSQERTELRLHIVKDHVSPLKSVKTALVAAAATSGIELSEERPFIQTVEEDPITGEIKRQTVWCLQDSEIDFLPAFQAERISTADFVKRFLDLKWRAENPHHPIAYMAWFYETLMGLKAQIKENKPLLLVRRGKRVAMIPQGCDPETREKLLSIL